jgi:hypothetical protein
MTINDIPTDRDRHFQFISAAFQKIKTLNSLGKTKLIHDLCDVMIQVHRPEEEEDTASE